MEDQVVGCSSEVEAFPILVVIERPRDEELEDWLGEQVKIGMIEAQDADTSVLSFEEWEALYLA